MDREDVFLMGINSTLKSLTIDYQISGEDATAPKDGINIIKEITTLPAAVRREKFPQRLMLWVASLDHARITLRSAAGLRRIGENIAYMTVEHPGFDHDRAIGRIQV
jgi:hypothetical protein